jgi:putative hemolysin
LDSDDPLIWAIILQIVLIFLNAIFACAEIAIISMNDNKLAKMAEQGNKRAVRLAILTSQPSRFLSTIQVAITLSGFLGSAFAADNFSDKLVNVLVKMGVTIPESTMDSIAVIVITLILSYFTLVFGELVPKRIGMKKAEALALGLSGLIHFISKIFAPIVWFLTASTNICLRILKIDPNSNEEEVTEEEIRMMIDAGSESGTIDQDEKDMIQNVFEFDDISVDEIATHRTDVTLLWEDDDLQKWEETINESRYSLYPVCSESVDNVIGILSTKDYFRLQDKSRENVMKCAIKPAYFVPETVKLDVLFQNMKKSHNHFAVVLDEYGGMVGIVTINDLLEQLVGDLEDENSLIDEEDDIVQIDSNTWKIRGTTTLRDISDQLGISLISEEYDTFNGLIFDVYGSIPNDGDEFEVETSGLTIKVISIKDHRVEQALVCLSKEEETEEGNNKE